jgi:hypothetical protein
MRGSLRALLTGIIDYAGLFPPASLPLDQALCNYARYRQEPESWMLGRFICPAVRLTELTPLIAQLYLSETLPVSVLCCTRPGNSDVQALLPADLDAVGNFLTANQGRATVDVLELKLPSWVGAPDRDADARDVPRQIATLIEDQAKPAVTAFHEISWSAQWRAALLAYVSALANDNQVGIAENRRQSRPAGFKLRSGGLEASAFPSSEQIAFAIAACRNARVPLKFTAGLHHPIRHFDAGVATKMHGFINVFAAGVLAHARGFEPAQIQGIIEDEDAGHFVFADGGLRWQDHQVATAEIVEARKRLVTSFGSCSFDEPRDDLRTLGWLQAS